MKIVYSTANFQTAGGGEARVAYEMSEAFSKNHTVLLVSPGFTNTTYDLHPNLTKLEFKSTGYEEFLIPHITPKNLSFLYFHLDQFKPDIIHSHDNTPLSAIVQAWARSRSVPFIFTSHELFKRRTEFGISEISKALTVLFDSRIIRNYYLDFFRNCDGVIALNETAKKDIIDYGYTGRIFIIHNGRNLKQYATLKLPDISSTERSLISIGWISERKNQLFLIQAMEYLPKNYSLHIIGGALNEKYAQKLYSYVSSHHLSNVHFIGRVSPEAIPSWLERSHLLISSSKMEVQSLVVLEALASGRPIVGLSNETIDELISDTVGKRLPADTDPQTYAHQIQKLCSISPSKYLTLCKNARKLVHGYDWTDVINKTIPAYESVIALKKPMEIKAEGYKISRFSRFPRSAGRLVAELRTLDKPLRTKITRFAGKPYIYLSVLMVLTLTGSAVYALNSYIQKTGKSKQTIPRLSSNKKSLRRQVFRKSE